MSDLEDNLGPGPWLDPTGLPTDDHDSFGWKLWVTCVVMIIFSGIFTSLRVWTRVSTKQLGTDDYVCVFAQVCVGANPQKRDSRCADTCVQLTAIVNVVCWTISVKKGYGVDPDVLATPQIQAFLRW